MRIILIETYSGFIYGDSADLDGKTFTGSPEEYAAALENYLGIRDPECTLEMVRTLGSDQEGYAAYRADIGGSEAITVVLDGQDEDTISAVTSSCEFLGYIVRQPKLGV